MKNVFLKVTDRVVKVVKVCGAVGCLLIGAQAQAQTYSGGSLTLPETNLPAISADPFQSAINMIGTGWMIFLVVAALLVVGTLFMIGRKWVRAVFGGGSKRL